MKRFHEGFIKRHNEKIKLGYADGYTIISYSQMVNIDNNFYNYAFHEFRRSIFYSSNPRNRIKKTILRFRNNTKDKSIDYTSKMFLIKMSRDRDVYDFYKKDIIDYGTQELYLQKKIYLVIDVYLIAENVRRIRNIIRRMIYNISNEELIKYMNDFRKNILPKVSNSVEQVKRDKQRNRKRKENIKQLILQAYPDWKKTIKKNVTRYIKNKKMTVFEFCSILGIHTQSYYQIVNDENCDVTRRLGELLAIINFLYSEKYMDTPML